jgi:Lrp/AsnC family transcriptional regulator, regulator for asnA, asnC and gidA
MSSRSHDDLDDTERQIIVELQHDGRITTNALARKVGVSEVTARRKLRRLQDDEIVQVMAGVDPFRVGLQSPAIVGVRVERDRLDEVARRLAGHDWVRYVAASTGNFHLTLEVIAPSNEDLAHFLLDEIVSIDGVVDTETALILRLYKQSSDWSIPAPGRDESPGANRARR